MNNKVLFLITFLQFGLHNVLSASAVQNQPLGTNLSLSRSSQELIKNSSMSCQCSIEQLVEVFVALLDDKLTIDQALSKISDYSKSNSDADGVKISLLHFYGFAWSMVTRLRKYQAGLSVKTGLKETGAALLGFALADISFCAVVKYCDVLEQGLFKRSLTSKEKVVNFVPFIFEINKTSIDETSRLLAEGFENGSGPANWLLWLSLLLQLRSMESLFQLSLIGLSQVKEEQIYVCSEVFEQAFKNAQIFVAKDETLKFEDVLWQELKSLSELAIINKQKDLGLDQDPKSVSVTVPKTFKIFTPFVQDVMNKGFAQVTVEALYLISFFSEHAHPQELFEIDSSKAFECLKEAQDKLNDFLQQDESLTPMSRRDFVNQLIADFLQGCAA